MTPFHSLSTLFSPASLCLAGGGQQQLGMLQGRQLPATWQGLTVLPCPLQCQERHKVILTSSVLPAVYKDQNNNKDHSTKFLIPLQTTALKTTLTSLYDTTLCPRSGGDTLPKSCCHLILPLVGCRQEPCRAFSLSLLGTESVTPWNDYGQQLQRSKPAVLWIRTENVQGLRNPGVSWNSQEFRTDLPWWTCYFQGSKDGLMYSPVPPLLSAFSWNLHVFTGFGLLFSFSLWNAQPSRTSYPNWHCDMTALWRPGSWSSNDPHGSPTELLCHHKETISSLCHPMETLPSLGCPPSIKTVQQGSNHGQDYSIWWEYVEVKEKKDPFIQTKNWGRGIWILAVIVVSHYQIFPY